MPVSSKAGVSASWMAEVTPPSNPHDAAAACGIEAVINGCVDPTAGRNP